MELLSELRRRNVFRMAVLYVVAAWLIMQVAEVLIVLANLPDWTGPTTLILVAIGFPIALIVSWFYEITPEGISLEKDVEPGESITHVTGRRLDFIVISLLCAAVILFAFDKWWTGGPPEKSIAVLAFENLSGDPVQDYFSDGISEELLNLLAQIPELRVISRSSAFSFKGKEVAIPTVAKQLNVSHVLEGSLRKVGNRVRITAQLVEVSSDSNLWSETYDRELNDIFAVQEEIAAAISDALSMKLALVDGEQAPLTLIKSASTNAYDAYLQGRDLIRRRGPENVGNAIGHLERSLRLDSDFAPAHAQLAIATGLMLYYGEYSLEEAKRIAIPHLHRAEELEPDLAEVHGGWALLAKSDADMIEHVRKALALNPNYADAMNWLYLNLSVLGRYEEAESALQQMLVTDPLTIVGRYNYGESLALQGRVDEARQIAEQLVEQSPVLGNKVHAFTSMFIEGKLAEGMAWALKAPFGFYMMHIFDWVGEYDEARRIGGSGSIWIYPAEGRWDDTIRDAQENMRRNPDSERAVALAGAVLYRAGRIDEALPLLERAFDFVPEGRPLSGSLSLVRTMGLALARRKAGDEDGAQAAAEIVRQDYAALRTVGWKNAELDLAEAMIAAFEHDPDGAIAALRSSIQHGLRYPRLSFDDPIFQDLRDEPRFVALQQELDAILAVQHDKVLQLICFNNPVPDDWRPMPETCEGVEEEEL